MPSATYRYISLKLQ